MRILVVDDEKDVELLFRQHFRKELRNAEIQLLFALSAEDALQQMQGPEGTGIVLILSDINMPGMSGLDLLKVLKERSPELKVYIITAYDDQEKYETAMRYKADGFMTKPIDFAALRKNVLASGHE